jgi:hypothetical protein
MGCDVARGPEDWAFYVTVGRDGFVIEANDELGITVQGRAIVHSAPMLDLTGQSVRRDEQDVNRLGRGRHAQRSSLVGAALVIAAYWFYRRHQLLAGRAEAYPNY